MNDSPSALAEITVADLLNSRPGAVRFFIDHGTTCAGCCLARFCTLQDVIRIHHLDEPVFHQDLSRLVSAQTL